MRRSDASTRDLVLDAAPRVGAPARVVVAHRRADAMATMAYHLARAGWRVSTASTKAELVALLDQEPLAAVLLDVALPERAADVIVGRPASDMDQLRPVILLLGAEGFEEQALDCFERGADDYVANSDSTREILLRLTRLLRQRAAIPRPVDQEDVAIDHAAHQAYAGGHPVDLTPTEFRLLGALVAQRGTLLDRRHILDAWGAPDDMSTRTVDMHVQRLRTKLSQAVPGTGDLIETVRGAGYRLASHSTTAESTSGMSAGSPGAARVSGAAARGRA